MHYDSFECHELLAKVIHDLFLLVHTSARVCNDQIFIKLDGLLAKVLDGLHCIQLLAHGRGTNSDDTTLFGQRINFSVRPEHEIHMIRFMLL